VWIDDDHKNEIEFLSMLFKYCNEIVKCQLSINNFIGVDIKPLLDMIMLQPLEKLSIVVGEFDPKKKGDAKEFVEALKFRSGTLKKLTLYGFEFNKHINLSLISQLERLERLKFVDCGGLTKQNYDKGEFRLREFELSHDSYGGNDDKKSKAAKKLINSFCGETLLKLSLNVVTLESVQTVKESCPNLKHLRVDVDTEEPLDLIIQLICSLKSLKILHIETGDYSESGSILKLLGDHLVFVECLILEMYIDRTVEYFAVNCKAKLKMWGMLAGDVYSRKYCLQWAYNFQLSRGSLKMLGIEVGEFDCEEEYDWSREELRIMALLKNQGVDVVSHDDFEDGLNDF
jgi:hypothetical protein